MLSRVANSIYWLGRYMERAENYARFINVNFNLMLDSPPDLKEQWEPLIMATGDHELYKSRNQSFDMHEVIYFLAFDQNNPNSIISSVSNARENARMIRENLTKETWEKLNETYHFVNKAANGKIWKKEDPRNFFEEVKSQILLSYGLADNTVARTEGWHFRQLGQYLERADKTSRILDVKYHILLPSAEEVGSPLDFLHWMALLKSVTAFNTYRRLYGNISPSGVVEFLVLNKYFPRSVFFCLKEAETCLYKISNSSGEGYSNSAEKAMGELRSKLEFDDVNDIISNGLHEYIEHMQIKINEISNKINDNYFQIKDNFASQTMVQE
ncbi:alpha-E domain-containing protein [Cyclobacterium sp. 1_MG-2023]|uniref:alpha-E domain-containing protein n=1 Tax=Cyclobacterium sp. 1_MG-2023 TaxID=3062681 RepID=UPI0026E39E72|nr:alpha-E domain-containing protein [Cyclobacterium sp. 1_MG-2023]MDO6436362.1 alpha-E domain-containing protein [Cyclobacterium sp. 1_MG-2023]